MNLAVKISKIFAAMANQRTRKCLPGFLGNFNRTGNEKLVVRMHVKNKLGVDVFGVYFSACVIGYEERGVKNCQ